MLDDPYMDLKQVLRSYQTISSEIKRRVEDDRFPKPTRLGKHRNSKLVWRTSKIAEWMEEQDQNGYDFIRKPANDNTPKEDAA